jgi:hypothetical protein
MPKVSVCMYNINIQFCLLALKLTKLLSKYLSLSFLFNSYSSLSPFFLNSSSFPPPPIVFFVILSLFGLLFSPLPLSSFFYCPHSLLSPLFALYPFFLLSYFPFYFPLIASILSFFPLYFLLIASIRSFLFSLPSLTSCLFTPPSSLAS